MQKLFSICFFLVLALQATCQTGTNQRPFIPADHIGPLLAGHRGGFESSLPENSLAMFDFTFRNACQAPVAIEFDIRESASGSLFIMHDSTVDRTTNGLGKISGLTDSYLETLFLRNRDGKLTNEKVPLFMEILSHFKDKNIVLMLDVKGNILEKVISIVRQMNMESKCILLTFSTAKTRTAKSLTDKMMISALVENQKDWESIREIQVPSWQMIAYVSEKTPEKIILDINSRKILLMADMSESIRNKSNHYEPVYYRDFIVKMHLDILISDYPLFVGRMYCKE